MPQKKPNGSDAKQIARGLSEDELDEVMENPTVKELLKKGNCNGK